MSRPGLCAAPVEDGGVCQRAPIHTGRHTSFVAEANRLDLAERYGHALARGEVTDLPATEPLALGLIVAARACVNFLAHHRDCDPLRTECRCGLWALQKAVREFEERYT